MSFLCFVGFIIKGAVRNLWLSCFGFYSCSKEKTLSPLELNFKERMSNVMLNRVCLLLKPTSV